MDCGGETGHETTAGLMLADPESAILLFVCKRNNTIGHPHC